MRVLVVLLLALASLTSCGDPDVRLHGAWRLDRVVDHGRETRIGHPHETLPSLGVGHGDTRAGATDGCTWYGYRITQDGGDISFEETEESRSYGPCYSFDPTHGALPSLLPVIDHATRDRHSLVLTGPGVRLELSRPPVDPPVTPRELDIEGGWLLTAGTVLGRSVPIVGATPVTLGMSSRWGAEPVPGRLRSGCATTHVRLAAGWFRSGPIRTAGRCDAGLRQIERTVLRGLKRVRQYDRIPGGMTLSGHGVALTFRFLPFVDFVRILGRWRVVETRTGGVTTSPTRRHRVPRDLGTLAVRDDKELAFTLHVGCRRLEGTWRPSKFETWLAVGARVTHPCTPSAGPAAEAIERAFATSTLFRLRDNVLAVQDHRGEGLLLRRIT